MEGSFREGTIVKLDETSLIIEVENLFFGCHHEINQPLSEIEQNLLGNRNKVPWQLKGGRRSSIDELGVCNKSMNSVAQSTVSD